MAEEIAFEKDGQTFETGFIRSTQKRWRKKLKMETL